MQFSHAFLATVRSMGTLELDSPGAVVFTLRGELTARDALGLSSTADDALADGLRLFIIDCGQVEHVSRTAFQVLVDIFARIRRYNAEIVMVSPSPYVIILMRSAGVVEFPRSVARLDDAVSRWDAKVTARLTVGR